MDMVDLISDGVKMGLNNFFYKGKYLNEEPKWNDSEKDERKEKGEKLMRKRRGNL